MGRNVTADPKNAQVFFGVAFGLVMAHAFLFAP